MSQLAASSTIGESPPPAPEPILEVSNLVVRFPSGNGFINAVDHLGLSVFPRQTLAVVGESGCGKSMTALSIMRLIQPPGRIADGRIQFQQRDLVRLPEKQMLRIRGGEIAMIFQEPMSSLNPVFSVGDQILEAILLHQTVNRKQAAELAIQAMHDVGIPDPAARLAAYPHQFSGGMRQRVMIAMALACQPKVLLADEPTTALDVTIQAQILDLLRQLQHQRGMAIVLITHDLGVVAQNADVVCVMYAGRIVEYTNVFNLFQRPLHPYTRGLLQCKPGLRERRPRLTTVADILDDPEQFKPLAGDSHGPRAWWPQRQSAGAYELREVEPAHWVACWGEADRHGASATPPRLDFRRP